ncbi:MAG: tryptophan-rich sensory protein, partial [FCB group bacterium]|nr:tryptophan-rich sensory protein [FCB group bacterium]
MMKIKNNYILIAALNFLLFIAMIAVNGLANGLPINGVTTGELSDLYPNLFVPAGLTFSIWGLIYLLLLLMTGFQLIAAINENTAILLPLKTQILLGLNFVLNIGWIFLWHYKLVFLSLLAMLGLLFTLIALFLKIYTISPAKPRHLIAVRFPVTVYFGWISVATIANVTAVLVSLNWGAWGISANIWTIIVMAVGTVLALW